MIKTFPNQYKKAITFSFDDGVTDDKLVVKLFNDYALKGTFNLNSGKIGTDDSFKIKDRDITFLSKKDVLSLYEGHEIAAHSVTHPPLETLTPEELYQETSVDIKALETLFNQKITGFGYPFGTYDERVIAQLEQLNITYARTVEDTFDFNLPKRLLTWHPTIHQGNEKMDEVIKQFLETDEVALLHIWGHSYELADSQAFERFKGICEQLAHREDCWYATNGEIAAYIVSHSLN